MHNETSTGCVTDIAAVRAAASGHAAAATPLYPTFADAARTARITDAVLRSAAARSWIEV